MLIKQQSPSLARHLSLKTFGELLSVLRTRGESAIPSLFDDPEKLYSASNKAKLFAKNVSRNSSLEESGRIRYPFTCFFFLELI